MQHAGTRSGRLAVDPGNQGKMAFETIFTGIQEDQGGVQSTLSECESAIRDRQAALRTQLALTVKAAAGQQDPGVDDAQAQQEALHGLCAALQPEPGRSLQEDSFESGLARHARTILQAHADLLEARVEDRATAARSFLQQVVSDFKSYMEAFQFLEAAVSIQRIQEEREKLNNMLDHMDSQEYVRAVIDEMDVMSGQFQETLYHGLHSSLQQYYLFFQQSEHFDWSASLVLVHVDLGSQNVWQAASCAGCLQSLLHYIAADVLNFVAYPILSCALTPVQLRKMFVQDEHGHDSYLALQLCFQDAAQPEDAAAEGEGDGVGGGGFQLPVGTLQLLVEFLHTHLFDGQKEFTQEFMEQLWPSCAQQCTVGSDAASSDLQSLSALVQAATGAESRLQQLKLLKHNGVAWSAMATQLAPQEATVFQSLQGEALLQVREMCKHAADWIDHAAEHVCVVGPGGGEARPGSQAATPWSAPAHSAGQGVEWDWASPLCSGDRVVWSAACDVLRVLRREVAALPPGESTLRATALSRTITDTVPLYELLVVGPNCLGALLRRVLIQLNSLWYLADGMLLLHAQLPGKVEWGAKLTGACIAASRSFAELAESLSARFVRKQAAKVKKFLHDLPELSSLDGQRGLAARKQVQRAVQAMRSMSEFMAQTCSPRFHMVCMAAVLAAVCESAERRILALQDVSQSDSEEIPLIFEKLWIDVPQAVAVHLVHGTANKRHPQKLPGLREMNEEAVAAAFCDLCPAVRKLKVLGELLTASMRVIVERWERLELQKHGFDAAQIVGLLRSTFQNNDYRRECIRKIQETK